MGKSGVSFFDRLLDLVSPRFCVVYGQRLAVCEQTLCSHCLMHLPFTGFEQNALENIMARMFWGHIPIERAAALFYYEAASGPSHILYELKYHNHPEIGETMGQLQATLLAHSGFFEGIDALVPVPLAKSRERQRGYNQSFMLARGISKVTALPILDKAVVRTNFAESQTQLRHWERLDNVEHAFTLRDAAAISGKHLLLIDDVVTTGATTTACARELLKAPAVTVSILSLAFTKNA